MRGRDPRHGGPASPRPERRRDRSPERRRGRAAEDGRALPWLALLVVLVLGAGLLVVYRTDAADQWLSEGWRDDALDAVLGEQEAAAPDDVEPPEGLELPTRARPAAVGDPVEAAAPDPRAVRRALAPYLADKDLGRHVLAAVSGLEATAPVFRRGTGTAIPASTTKLLTAVAALEVLDPGTAFTTRVVRDGRRVTLVGSGDPLLAAEPPEEGTYPPRADVTTLARDAARALLADGVRRVRLGYDDSLFTGPADNPRWRASYVPDGVVAPTSALWVDEGRPESGTGRVEDPALAAATVFATELARAGVRVTGPLRRRTADAGAQPVAEVTGPTVRQLVEHLLRVSDNEASEVLVRHIGLAAAGEGSTEAGTRAVLAALVRLGVPTAGVELYDGSGLSRQNRIGPDTLLGVLRAAAAEPDLRSVLAALPVAAYTGSLTDRFDEAAPAGRGRVRAKTGTLTGVSSLAGIATGVDGTPMLFVLMADKVAVADTLDARDALDGAAAALGACRCGPAA